MFADRPGHAPLPRPTVLAECPNRMSLNLPPSLLVHAV